MKRISIAIAVLAVAVPVFAQKADARLKESTAVLTTILEKQSIPSALVNKARCIMVYPGVKKVGIGLGVTYGRGVMVCREGQQMTGKWGAPIMYKLDVGSLGAQLGSTSTDYVLLVLSQRGADKVLSGKLKLGAGAQAVAGPSGAQASAFNDPNVDILTYSQSKGLFAGASLGSASMDADGDMNKELYGKDINASQIRESSTEIPAGAKPLITELTKISPKHIS
ncbi:MAG: lipid-binding SYLF domain-containing protein [Acidobacteriaceae bacterium]|nr:lipid-binding SYLF domain-containing protein [Acidobacteriaceae bacterium]